MAADKDPTGITCRMVTPKKNFPSDPRRMTGGYREMHWMAHFGWLILLLSCAIAAPLQPSQVTTPNSAGRYFLFPQPIEKFFSKLAA